MFRGCLGLVEPISQDPMLHVAPRARQLHARKSPTPSGIEGMTVRNISAVNCAVTAGVQGNWGSCMGTYAFHSLAVHGLA